MCQPGQARGRIQNLGRRPLCVTFILALGCEAEPPEIEAFSRTWVSEAAESYRVYFFEGQTCASVALAHGRVDLVRTSTPTFARTRSELGVLDEVTSDLPGALVVRALEADGTPLAMRCLDIVRGLSLARFEVLPLAPERATLTVEEGEAKRIGATFVGLLATVHDSEGRPVKGVPISRGPGLTLSLTDEAGQVNVRTPTEAPDREQLLRVEAYGVLGPSIPRSSLQLEAAACPRTLATFPLPGEPGAGTIELLVGTNDAVIARPRPPVEGGGFALDRVRPTAGRLGLERVATATIAGHAPFARDPNDARRIAFVEGSGARVARLGDDGLEPGAIYETSSIPSALAFSPSGALYAAVDGRAIDLESGAIVAGPTDARDLAFIDLDGDAEAELVITEPGRVFGLGSRPLDAGGRIGAAALDTRASGLNAIVLAGSDALTIASPRLELTRHHLEGVTRAVGLELGGDGLEDLVAQAPSALAVLTGDGRSALVRTATCPIEATGLARWDVDGDGAPEALIAEPGAWRVSILGR
ncbi:MAG: hypothetical protein HYV07_20530 [Deltaproteobacteria bacterium]|nr:hypothetical protein [Deltaproteobacteria bacterium]